MRLRSSSMGSKPKPRLHRASRAESATALALDVRCACQFYETKSLLPERVNPIGYDTTDEFGPCIHVQARPKSPAEIQRMLESEAGFSVRIAKTSPLNRSDQMFVPPVTNHINIPPEFSPAALNENAKINHNISSPMLANRSVSCNNMGIMHNMHQPPTPFMKQKDPSTSSLLRKRMSEERQGFSAMDKRMSQSTASHDRFIPQKDPSQSTILRRKMYNRSTASFGYMTTDRHSTERAPPPNTFQPIQMSNERTFYHDTNDAVRNSNVNIVEESRTLDRAAPLSMKSHGNRRFVPSSIENLPIKMDENRQPVERYENINRAMVKPQMPIKFPIIQRDITKCDPRDQNVSDEEKVQILLSRSHSITAAARSFLERKQSEVEMSQIVDLKPVPVPSQMQRMNAEDVKDVQVAVQAKPQVQYVAKMENTLHPMEAQNNDYSYSKLFDNYQSDPVSLTTETNISTPDLNKGYIRQRDPSRSPFTRNRYRALNTPTQIEMISSKEQLLSPAGVFPERRASEQCNPQILQQKDLRSSNVLNRRRRNLSQTSLEPDNGLIDPMDAPLKMVKTLSFEKNLAQRESEHLSPYVGLGIKMTKSVSFEFDQNFTNDHIDGQFMNIHSQNYISGESHRLLRR